MNLSWSDSYLNVWEKCKLWAFFQYVKRLPYERPDAARRGLDVHAVLESFISEDGPSGPIPPSVQSFSEELHMLGRYASSRLVDKELKIGINRDWMRVSWGEAWGRFVYDARVRFSPRERLIIDYKTGRKSGNEIKHTQQGQRYMLSEFLLEPETEIVHVEFWYTDENDLMTTTYTRAQGLKFFKHINARAIEATNPDQEWKPEPSAWACRYCPYRQDRGGQCHVGVITKPGRPRSRPARDRQASQS